MLALLLAFALHPDSLSSSHIRVDGEQAHVRLRCQIESLLEVIEGLDANADGSVDANEFAAKRGEVEAYVCERYRLKTGTDRRLRGGRELTVSPVTAALGEPDPDIPSPYTEWADIELLFRAEAPILDLQIEFDLFFETSPDHLDFVTIEWDAETATTFVLERDAARARSAPEGRGVLPAFARLGAEHILSGWDHLAFLAALVLACYRWRSLLWVVTAFTLAHSVTLALAALDFVDTRAYASFIEQLIALSIAYVAAETWLYPKVKRSRWIEAFVFGLVHGLGFAGFLAHSLMAERSKGLALAAFNVGVELGQLLVVAAAAFALRALPRSESPEDDFLAPTRVRRWGSAAVCVLGLYWFVERLN